jgi:alkaline phosphatase
MMHTKLLPLRNLLLFTFVILISGCSPQQKKEIAQPESYNTIPQQTRIGKPRNIIFMIGDGMGLSQISAGMFANGNQLQLERFPVVGLHKPYASNKLITDSAAGATAFSCGVKTYNGAIGVDPNKKPVKTILEEAEEQGRATGLVATSTIVHATPASFIAHQPQRKMYEEIAADFLKTDIDLFIGGGKKYFDRREKDDRNLSEELRQKGYLVSSYFEEDITELNPKSNKGLVYFTADDDPLPVASGRDYLPPASKLSVDYLDTRSPAGFFLMIEGSQIDWGGHANNTDYIISEMLDFDKAIAEVMDFAEKDGQTLVLITADHETGGFAIDQTSTMENIVGKFTSDYHTGTLVPVFAYGPGAEMFGGIYENTAIYHKLRALLGLNPR